MNRKGQASLEYFILFAVIAVITVAAFSTYLPKILESIQGESADKPGFFQKAATEITK